MRYACLLMLLSVAVVADVGPVDTAGQQGAAARPQTIFWPQAPNNPNPPTPVGLLYTPEVLAVLAARSPASVTARIEQAIREQTPIVVLWAIPPTANSEPLPRPFSTVIVEPHGDSFGFPSPGSGVRVEPLWVEQHAEELRQLDRRTEFGDVGVMAAFPRPAFVPGRLITIYLRLRAESGGERRVQRFGLIQWNGTAP